MNSLYPRAGLVSLGCPIRIEPHRDRIWIDVSLEVADQESLTKDLWAGLGERAYKALAEEQAKRAPTIPLGYSIKDVCEALPRYFGSGERRILERVVGTYLWNFVQEQAVEKSDPEFCQCLIDVVAEANYGDAFHLLERACEASVMKAIREPPRNCMVYVDTKMGQFRYHVLVPTAPVKEERPLMGSDKQLTPAHSRLREAIRQRARSSANRAMGAGRHSLSGN